MSDPQPTAPSGGASIAGVASTRSRRWLVEALPNEILAAGLNGCIAAVWLVAFALSHPTGSALFAFAWQAVGSGGFSLWFELRGVRKGITRSEPAPDLPLLTPLRSLGRPSRLGLMLVLLAFSAGWSIVTYSWGDGGRAFAVGAGVFVGGAIAAATSATWIRRWERRHSGRIVRASRGAATFFVLPP